MMMGINKLLNYKMLWDTSGLWECKLIRSKMISDRFVSIGGYVTIGSKNNL